MNADQMKELVKLCRHEAIAGKRGEIQFGDFAWYPEIKRIGTLSPYIEHNQFVWLPPVYDYQHPERGLWGMVEWDNATIINTVSNGIVCVSTYGPVTQHFGPLPIALAKAVIWQSERKQP